MSVHFCLSVNFQDLSPANMGGESGSRTFSDMRKLRRIRKNILRLLDLLDSFYNYECFTTSQNKCKLESFSVDVFKDVIPFCVKII